MMRRDTPEPGARVLPWFGTEILARQVPTPAAAGLDGASSIGFARNWDPSPISPQCSLRGHHARDCQWSRCLTSLQFFVLGAAAGWRCGNVNPPSDDLTSYAGTAIRPPVAVGYCAAA